MANNPKAKDNLKAPWKPGESGNPDGRPPLSDDIKAAREINKQELERILGKLINLSFQEIVELMKVPTTPALELIVCKIITEAIKKGDQAKLGFILERLPVGPPTKKLGLELGDSIHATLIELIHNLEGKK